MELGDDDDVDNDDLDSGEYDDPDYVANKVHETVSEIDIDESDDPDYGNCVKEMDYGEDVVVVRGYLGNIQRKMSSSSALCEIVLGCQFALLLLIHSDVDGVISPMKSMSSTISLCCTPSVIMISLRTIHQVIKKNL
ncbi:unnamed protein product [Meganyctiphanes norvegica]|uniref:Uncharacterized protein n=1 Tax=Meganyctiphanes norvegica TaxID=48144 RepID=A0AAV2R3M9_MEGNR